MTGISGFVGRAFSKRACDSGWQLRGTSRYNYAMANGIEMVLMPSIDGTTDWSKVLQGIQCVVHLAARVHVMNERSKNPLEEFRQINVYATLNLAIQAAKAGVKRFVFVSSIKVNGEETKPNQPFKPGDRSTPRDAYGVSKMEAEEGLRVIAAQTGLQVVIIRPPLVYGPGVKGNFASMVHWLQIGIPLPLGAIHNQRSLVAVENLVDLIVTCLTHPGAANKTFLVSDGQDVSTTELLRRMAAALGKRAWLLPVPQNVLQFIAQTIGKQDVVRRLCGTLQVDISKNREILGWEPPLTLHAGLARVALSYRVIHGN